VVKDGDEGVQETGGPVLDAEIPKRGGKQTVKKE